MITHHKRRFIMKGKWFVFLVLLIGLVPFGILAKSPVTASIDHQIVLIKDLIEDYAESNWTVVTQSGGTYGDAIGGVDRVRLGVETGYFTNARQYVDDDSVQKEVIEVNAQPIGTDQIQEVRGAYLVTLPQFKRSQLEINYEVPITDESGVMDEYYVEVFERNHLNRDEWVSIETIKKNEELKAAPLNILENKKEKFSVNSYVANLSQWSGREIRLDLVSQIQKNSNMKPGRWTRLRLVGATFDYKFVDFDEKSTASGSISALSVREPKFIPRFDPYVSPGYATYAIPDLNYYADTGPAPIYINNRWVAYFNANYRPARDICVDGRAHGGSMAFDLINNATYNLYTLVPGVASNGLLRLIGGVPTPSSNTNYTPYATIAPYRPANPLATPMTWKHLWVNGYTGVNSAFVATDNGQTRVHAFLHVEDWFMNTKNADFLYSVCNGINYIDSNPNNNYFYARIGYARSPHNQAYPLQFQRCYDDVSSPAINNASPIIECFQRESDIIVRQGIKGCAGPAVIRSGGYIYLFYTRYVQPALIEPDPVNNPGKYNINWITGKEFETSEIAIIDHPRSTYNNNICVARFQESGIISEYYESIHTSSPWIKYYNNQWSNQGKNFARGGLDQPIITDIGSSDDHRILCHVLYNTYLNKYMMLTWNPLTYNTYLYICPDLSTQQWGTGIMLSMPTTEIGIRLIGNGGDDKEGGQSMMFYTRERAYPGYNTILEERALWLEQ